MIALNEKIVDEALSLPADMRLALIDRLLQSLNTPAQRDNDALWAEEAERRIQQVASGQAKAIPGAQVFKEIRERLKP